MARCVSQKMECGQLYSIFRAFFLGHDSGRIIESYVHLLPDVKGGGEGEVDEIRFAAGRHLGTILLGKIEGRGGDI